MALMNIDTFQRIAKETIIEAVNRYEDDFSFAATIFRKDIKAIKTSIELSWFLDQFTSRNGNELYHQKHSDISDEHMGRLLTIAKELHRKLCFTELYELFPRATGSVNYRVVDITCDRNGNWTRKVQFYGVCRSDVRKLFQQATRQVAEALQLRYDYRTRCCYIVTDAVELEIERLSRMLYDVPLALFPIEHNF